jgi:hypothetical protein
MAARRRRRRRGRPGDDMKGRGTSEEKPEGQRTVYSSAQLKPD